MLTANPDQHKIILIDRHTLHLDQFEFQIVDTRIIEFEFPLQSVTRLPRPVF